MRILNWILNILLLICVTSCINHTEITDDSHSLLAISVKDAGFSPENNQKTTRAIDNGYATTFTKGDQMGLYVLDASGNVKMANLCLTYDGTNWNYPAGTTLYYDDTSRKYFAYYPYQSTITDVPATSAATTAANFFSTLISNWKPSTDQSSQAKYTASDLMVGTGAVGTLASNATRPITFNMAHQMALIDLNIPYYYLSTDNNYTYTFGLTYVGFNPFHLSKGNYRYIIKPGTSTSIWGSYCPTTSSTTSNVFNKAFSAASGTYQTMNVDGGAVGTSHTLAIGEYYLNDGSIIPNATANKFLLDKVIGVVFSTSTSTIDKGYGWTHGYAMALTNATTRCLWSTNSNDEMLTNYTTYTAFIQNKDGYTETQTIKDHGLKAFNKDNYPSFWYALNYGSDNEPGTTQYAAPSTSSGWYLPSIGQWYDICVNLGGLSPTILSSTTTASCCWYDNGATNYASIFVSNINQYLLKLSSKGYAVTKFTRTISLDGYLEGYWSSSEYTNEKSYSMFPSTDSVWLTYNGYSNTTKQSTWDVRAVIAF